MKFLSLIFVYLGAILLFASLFPTRRLCRQDHPGTFVWRILGILILLFIGGYGLYGSLILKTGELQSIHVIVSLIMFGGGVFVAAVVRQTQSAINHILRMAEQEKYRALHDDLTDLPNRTLLQDRIDQLVLLSERSEHTFTIFLIDLDNFKEINDALGHFYGDYLLQQVSERLSKAVRKCDTLARWGGDKFALLLPDTSVEEAEAVSMKITEIITPPFQVEGNNLAVGVNIGIVTYPEHGQDTGTLLQHADIAMYEAKRNQVNYCLFNPEKNRTTWDRLILMGELRKAIESGHLILHFQPQISVLDGRLSGIEALVRWQHEKKGLIQPDEFISLIEQSGLSKPLTNFVLDKALEHYSLWRESAMKTGISINISVKNLHDFDFPGQVKATLDKWGIEPDRLTLEITESSIMADPGRVALVVESLKKLGVRLAIDDFGTGYSSLQYLRQFPAREIKIDKSFVTDMLSNEDNAVIVKSTIDMAHNIGRQVVAEGVEDHETGVLLKRLGCDYLQGFHISHPLPPDDLFLWYEKQKDKQKNGA
ncbi:MAG: EAL domain-containing protein [Proteobacteria bacterium]|nr:EAL domain-containing protein [Pseudomonadota bacterium]MBU1738710.1 EAL domain-containing protein [Pseudomonadota bacterium]